MDKPSPEKIASLPVWARKHIDDLSHAREIATSTLNKFLDEQTPSPIYTESHIYTGENSEHAGPTTKRRYINATRLTVMHAGVELSIACEPDERSGDKGGHIKLQWSDPERGVKHVAMIPQTLHGVILVTKENMR